METSLIYETQAGPFWDWKVAVDLFLGGAGIGAFLMAVGLNTFFHGRFPRLCQTAAWLSPILVVGGFLFLLLKIGRPHHLLLVFTNFSPLSPLWWGGIFQTVFVVGCILYAWKWLDSKKGSERSRVLGWALSPLAVIVGAYHGMLLSMIMARPLWNTGPTVVAAVVGFATTGIAAVMLVHLVRMKLAGRLTDEEHVAGFLDKMIPVRHLLVAGLVIQLITFFLWWLSLRFGDLQDTQALSAANEAFGPMFWWLGIGLGLILPLILGGIATLRGWDTRRSLQVHAIAWTSAMILVGGFFFRLSVVLGGQIALPIPTLS